MHGMQAKGIRHISEKQVTAFRLSRHHLNYRVHSGAMTSVAGEIGGAQAQLLLAGQMSIRARVRDATLSNLEAALWGERTLAKAWCMRRTMFLLPSNELALFVRGSALRAEREIRWVLSKGVPAQQLERLVKGVLKALEKPITQSALAQAVSELLGLKVIYRFGGGWGSRRKTACVRVGGLALPAPYLLHLAGARGVYCSGPNEGSESTFVRADKWIPHWKDMPQDKAERELVKRYLEAFGPSTVSDFAIWTGMTAGDARGVWSLLEEDMAQVDVEGWSASVLLRDLPELMDAHLEAPVVRLLPFFDSFLLGHKSHRYIVGPAEHKQVYRPQGWVSPVLLVDGRAMGVWSHIRKANMLEVDVRPFTSLSAGVSKNVRDEADELGRFLGCPAVNVKFS